MSVHTLRGRYVNCFSVLYMLCLNAEFARCTTSIQWNLVIANTVKGEIPVWSEPLSNPTYIPMQLANVGVKILLELNLFTLMRFHCIRICIGLKGGSHPLTNLSLTPQNILSIYYICTCPQPTIMSAQERCDDITREAVSDLTGCPL